MNDHSAAEPLEISAGQAEKAEECLQAFAEDSELDVALVVDHSGALVAGITAASEVQVETIGALVAGAAGAIRALGSEVGESDPLETLHQGTDQVVYLREMGERFILVGIAESEIPAGVVREKAAQVATPLISVLEGSGGEDAESGGSNFEEEGKAGDEGAPVFELRSGDEEEEDAGEEAAAPTLAVDSPFEMADGDEEAELAVEVEEDAESEPELEEEAEVAKSDGEEVTIVREEENGEVPAAESDEVPGEEIPVSAPLLVEPAIAPAEDPGDDLPEEVAAISTSIAADIGSEPDGDAGEEEDDGEEDEPSGGPRYVFEIG